MQRSRVVLLGPQRLHRTLGGTIASLGIRGRLAAVTAGWEEREDEDQEMHEHLGGRTVNLSIYRRAEDVMSRDPELARAIRARHERLRDQHALYKLRHEHAISAARELFRRWIEPAHADLLEAERENAVQQVRAVDAFQLERVALIHREFEERWRPIERESVARHRAEIARTLDDCEGLCVAGGHVTVLLHRLRLFDVLGLVGAKPIVAWSAGAMAIGERVVLFHDSPPQGHGAAEVWEMGLGAYHGLLPFPHAKKRLHLFDQNRVALLARRFAPAACVALDPMTRMDWDGERWHGAPGTLQLHERGHLVQAGAA